MALMHSDTRDVIRKGTRFDHCIICNQQGEHVAGMLQDQDIFNFKFNGLEYSMCLKHLNMLLGEYHIVKKEEDDLCNQK